MLNKLKRWWNNSVYWNDSAYWKQSEATTLLLNAWSYLWRQFWAMASTTERGRLLPEQKEALDILYELAKESFDKQCSL